MPWAAYKFEFPLLDGLHTAALKKKVAGLLIWVMVMTASVWIENEVTVAWILQTHFKSRQSIQVDFRIWEDHETDHNRVPLFAAYVRSSQLSHNNPMIELQTSPSYGFSGNIQP